MNKLLIALLAILLIGGAIFIFVKKPNVTPSTTSNTVTTDSNTVSIQNFAFSPATLTVKAGTTVTWVNNDSTVHTIKSDSFNSDNLNRGDKFTFTFNTPGSFGYVCGIHPDMKGTIVVQ